MPDTPVWAQQIIDRQGEFKEDIQELKTAVDDIHDRLYVPSNGNSLCAQVRQNARSLEAIAQSKAAAEKAKRRALTGAGIAVLGAVVTVAGPFIINAFM